MEQLRIFKEDNVKLQNESLTLNYIQILASGSFSFKEKLGHFCL